MASGRAVEKGGNLRNMLTQQNLSPLPFPPPSQLRMGVRGGLMAENLQMLGTHSPLPHPAPPRFPYCVSGGGGKQEADSHEVGPLHSTPQVAGRQAKGDEEGT